MDINVGIFCCKGEFLGVSGITYDLDFRSLYAEVGSLARLGVNCTEVGSGKFEYSGGRAWGDLVVIMKT